jgi:hypothetical protein
MELWPDNQTTRQPTTIFSKENLSIKIYLHTKTHQHASQNYVVLTTTFINHAKRINDTECLNDEISPLRKTFRQNTKCYWEVPGLLMLLTASVKEDERGGPRTYFRKPIASVLPCDTALWTHIAFIWVLLQLRVSFCLWWMAKSSNVSASNFKWSSVNPQPKPLKCFVRLWWTFFKLDSGIWMTFRFQGWLIVSWRWWTFRATKHQ